MSRTNDSLFHKEFRDMMNGRRALAGSFKLGDIPLPKIDSMIKGTPKGHMVLIRNIKEKFFDRLNGEEVQLVGRATLQKRQVTSDGSFREDAQGTIVTEQVTVPQSCVAILSSTSIGLRRFVEEDGKKYEHKVSEGFRYVDYVDTKQGRKYIYIIPRDYAFRLNMCALILTPNKRRVYYKGSKLALQNGNYVYMYVIPFKYRETADSLILGVKSDINFDAEVRKIMTYWIQLGVLFDLNVTKLENQINGLTNEGIIDFEGTVVAEDYRRYSVSLAEEKEDVLKDLIEN